MEIPPPLAPGGVVERIACSAQDLPPAEVAREELDLGTATIPTEMVTLELRCQSALLGELRIRRSLGAVEDVHLKCVGGASAGTPCRTGEDCCSGTCGGDVSAFLSGHSFFDIFVEVQIPQLGITLVNADPVRMEADIQNLPPREAVYIPPAQTLPLFIKGTTTEVGRLLHAAHDPSDCGDGMIEPGETCDDGNKVSCDGCSANCQDEQELERQLGFVPCEDGVFCTEGDFCEAGQCKPGGPRDCSFRDTQCAVGFCDEAQGSCGKVPRPGAGACDDGNACTMDDACSAGECRGTPAAVGTPCDDADACTSSDGAPGGADRCDGTGQCLGRAVVCPDDGVFCDGQAVCQDGTCTESGSPCSAPQVCNEAEDRCESPATSTTTTTSTSSTISSTTVTTSSTTSSTTIRPTTTTTTSTTTTMRSTTTSSSTTTTAPPPAPIVGHMEASGTSLVGTDSKYDIKLGCDPTVHSQHFETTFMYQGRKVKFTADQFLNAVCQNVPGITPEKVDADFNTISGTAVGHLDKFPGSYRAVYMFQDNGKSPTGSNAGYYRIEITGTGQVVFATAPTVILLPVDQGNNEAKRGAE